MQTYTIVVHILKYRRTNGIFVTDNSNFYLEPYYTITIIIPKTSPFFFQIGIESFHGCTILS